ncbi:amino acid adenylation domain-containing protein [Micromonospora sp. R77]|uniref:non-ribosomal peptide synthetase n=1 Tax=Micromonospora sp. R77 TaxID=2925836 RepID=UPI001F6041FC|nr:amino acid adenylation domain-containing protein [Micromonospora sp. R77]MCI4066844.1 amino acid adenylation domain-containing protein [Micromonospora sp. R77]
MTTPRHEVRLPLTPAQRQLWIIDQLSPGESTYNSPLIYRLRGPVDARALRGALTVLLARHDGLRTRFAVSDGVPYQVIGPPPEEADLDVVDLPAVASGDRDEAIAAALHTEVTALFDLHVGPLYRFRLIRVDEADHILVLGFHHVVTDGWSTGIIQRDLSAAYRALVAGEVPRLPAPRSDFAGYVRAHAERLTDDALAQGLRHWEETLRGLPTLDLPADRPRPPVPSQRGGTVVRRLDGELLAGLRKVAGEANASLFMVLTTGLAAVLHAHSRREDVPLGVPMLGRADPELEDVVGLFVNMVVLRLDLTGDPTLGELLTRVTDASFSLYDHEEVPFEKVVERVRPLRDPSRNPLFQVATQLLGDGTTGDGLDLPGVDAARLVPPSGRAQFDLSVDFTLAGDTLGMHVEYATDLFDQWRAEALADHVERVLRALPGELSTPLSRLSLLTGAEQQALLRLGDGGPAVVPTRPLHAGIAATAAAAPDAVAAICRDRQLSYGELWAQAERLARRLRARGVRRQDVVALVLDRDLDVLPAMLGVLAAGGAIAPLDPRNPAERTARLVRDAGARVVITRRAFADRLPEPAGGAVLLLDEPADEDAGGETAEADPVGPDSLAYLIYTSGSTGGPKGVQVEHGAMGLYAAHYIDLLGLRPGDRVLQFAALTFDVSLGEIFASLLAGATLVLVAPEQAESPTEVAALIRRENVTCVALTPTVLGLLETDPYPALSRVVSIGEALSAELANAWIRPGRRLLNVYGPTEVAVACTDHDCGSQPSRTPPPIGRPHPGRRLYVVNPADRLVPRGVPGELLIGGAGLARGYLDRPELTAERFAADPFRPGGRIYRSGDLVRWNADGELEYLGRTDQQVKLHGIRIEPGEIESALLTHPGIRLAVVAVRADPHVGQRLVGYLVPEGTARPTPAGLREFLAGILPPPMIPTAWVFLDELPMTASAKVDRAALPDPADDADADAGTVAAATPTEVTLVRIFADVLGRSEVGADGNLFELGGSSLQAMRVISRVTREFGVKLNLRQLYGTSTVRAIAAHIDGLAASTDGGRS